MSHMMAYNRFTTTRRKGDRERLTPNKSMLDFTRLKEKEEKKN